MIFTLFRYVGLYEKSVGINRKRKFLNTFLILASIILFNIVIYYLLKRVYNNLSVLKEASYLFFLFISTYFSLMFLSSFISWGTTAFARTPEIEYLLSMPIRKKTLAIYQVIVTTILQIAQLSLFFANAFAYANSVKEFISFFYIRLLLNIFYLFSVGSLVSILLGGFSSKFLVKKINSIVALLSIFIVLLFTYFLSLDPSKPGYQFRIIRFLFFFDSKYNPFSWSIRDDLVQNILVFVISFSCFLTFLAISSKISFDPTIRTVYTKQVSFKRQEKFSIFSPVFVKDFKAFIHNEAFLVFIIYPSAFGWLMRFISNNTIASLTAFSSIAVTYVAFESGLLMKEDKNHIKYVSILPLSFKNSVLPKIFIPVFVNSIILVFFSTLFYSRFTDTLSFMLSILVIFSQFLLASLMGVYATLSNEKSVAKKQPFGFLTAIWIEFVTISSCTSILVPMNLILSNFYRPGMRMYDFSIKVLVGAIIFDLVAVFYITITLKKKYLSSIEKA